MLSINQLLLLGALLCCSVFNLMGQAACYDKLVAAGNQYRIDGKYPEAMNQFWAAFECQDKPDDHGLEAEIRRVQDEWISDLTNQAKAAKKAQEKAEAAEERALEAKEKEAQARIEAQQNAEKARLKSRQIESLRLSLLASKAQTLGKADTALLLAYLGLQLWPEDSLSSKMKAFSSAVKDSFEVPLVQHTTPLVRAQPLTEGKGIIAFFEGYSCLIDSTGTQKLPISMEGAEARKAIYAPDGTMALAVSGGNKAQLWARSMGDKTIAISGHDREILGGDISSQAGEALTCSRDHTARLWNASGVQKASFTGHNGNVYDAKFDQQGRHFLTRSSDGTVRIWDRNGNCNGVLKDDKGYIYQASFSPDGQQVATAGASGAVCLWSLHGEKQAEMMQDDPVIEIRYINDGHHLLSRSVRDIRIWNADGTLIQALTIEGQAIKGMQWYEARKILLAWAYDGQLILSKLYSDEQQRYAGHEAPVKHARLSPDGTQLLTTAEDGTSRLWDSSGNTLISWDLQSENPLPAFFGNDGKAIYTAQNGNRELKACPNPVNKYLEMKEKEDELQDVFAVLKERYNLYLED